GERAERLLQRLDAHVAELLPVGLRLDRFPRLEVALVDGGAPLRGIAGEHLVEGGVLEVVRFEDGGVEGTELRGEVVLGGETGAEHEQGRRHGGDEAEHGAGEEVWFHGALNITESRGGVYRPAPCGGCLKMDCTDFAPPPLQRIRAPCNACNETK